MSKSKQTAEHETKLIHNRVVMLKRQEEKMQFKIKVAERQTSNLLKKRERVKESLQNEILEDQLKEEELVKKKLEAYR